MLRRSVVFALGSSLLAAPLPARAQEHKLRRIGMLLPFASDDAQTSYRILAFEDGMAKLGWLKGGNIDILYRNAPQRAALQDYARELVSEGCEVLVAATNISLDALLAQTRVIPIIFVHVGDPVATGRLKDLARPGGNFTGFVNFEYSMLQKQVQVIITVAPQTKRIAVLFNRETLGLGVGPTLKAARAAADSLGLELLDAAVSGVDDLDRTFAGLAAQSGVSLFVAPDVFAASNRKAIVESVAKHRLPTIYFGAYFVEDGGLISYGIEPFDLYRRAASYVDKCLKGANPGELPVQFPVRFEMAINLKTADSLGLVIPASILAQAERVFD